MLTTLTLIPGIAGLGVTAWQLTHHNATPTATRPNANTPVVTAARPKTTPTAAATTPPAATAQSCTSQTGGYTVQYPPGWVTESATPAQACHFFGATPFTVNTTDLAAGDIAIDTSVHGTYDQLIAALHQPSDASITTRLQPLTINGHRAGQMNTIIHAGAKPSYSYGYVIDHHNRPLTITTRNVRHRSPALQRILTQMLRALQLH